MSASPRRVQVAGLEAIRLESSHLGLTILLGQGADLLELIHKPTGIDVLWKVSPEALSEAGGPATGEASFVDWVRRYRGGWQTILPNFGPAVEFHGRQLPFHGEAARVPWQLEEAGTTPDGVRAVVSAILTSMPLSVRREVLLVAERPVVRIRETVTNMSAESSDCMWGQHPVFGAPLVSPASVIYTGARRVVTDDGFKRAGNDLPPGATFEWPMGVTRTGQPVDLSHPPSPGSGISRVAWLQDFTDGWFAIVNPTLPLGVGVRWNRKLMPFACMWQEAGGASGFPHFGKAYALAIEPQTSYFGHGLLEAISRTRTQMTLLPGESRTLDLTVVLFEDARRVHSIGRDGTWNSQPTIGHETGAA